MKNNKLITLETTEVEIEQQEEKKTWKIDVVFERKQEIRGESEKSYGNFKKEETEVGKSTKWERKHMGWFHWEKNGEIEKFWTKNERERERVVGGRGEAPGVITSSVETPHSDHHIQYGGFREYTISRIQNRHFLCES